MNVQAYPKIELHLHMDCSLSYKVVSTIDPSISRAVYQRDFVAPTKCTNLADFLTRAPRAIALMQTAERLRLVVKDVFEQLQRDSVLYAEMRFAPPTRQHIYDRTHFCQRWRGQRCRRATRQFSPEAIRFRAGDDRRDVDLGAVLAALCIRV